MKFCRRGFLVRAASLFALPFAARQANASIPLKAPERTKKSEKAVYDDLRANLHHLI